MHRYAFTLIELLVVIAIIAILSTMLIPVIGMVRTQANNTACMSNARQLAMSALSYANDQEGRIDMRNQGQPDSAGDWTIALQAGGFVTDRRIYSCPTSRHFSGISYANFMKKIAGFADPSVPSLADGMCNYGAHVAKWDTTWGAPSDPEGPIGTTGTWQGSLTHIAQATSNDCLLMEFSPGGPSGYNWLGLGMTHWGKDNFPTGFTVAWFDGSVTRCPESKVVNSWGTYSVSQSYAR